MNYQVYISPVVDEHMITKYWWVNAEKLKPCPSATFPTKISAWTTLAYKQDLLIEKQARLTA
jgi:hypothetical protein